MVRDFDNLDLTALIDLLALYTSKYTQFLNEGGLNEDFKNYGELILQLQSEIEFRRTQANIIPVIRV